VAIQEIVGRLTLPWIAASAFGLLAMTPPWELRKKTYRPKRWLVLHRLELPDPG